MKTIRALREERRLTQAQLANALDVAPSTVYFWESGKSTPSAPQLRKIAQFFNVASDDIALVGIDVDRSGDPLEAPVS